MLRVSKISCYARAFSGNAGGWGDGDQTTGVIARLVELSVRRIAEVWKCLDGVALGVFEFVPGGLNRGEVQPYEIWRILVLGCFGRLRVGIKYDATRVSVGLMIISGELVLIITVFSLESSNIFFSPGHGAQSTR